MCHIANLQGQTNTFFFSLWMTANLKSKNNNMYQKKITSACREKEVWFLLILPGVCCCYYLCGAARIESHQGSFNPVSCTLLKAPAPSLWKQRGHMVQRSVTKFTGPLVHPQLDALLGFLVWWGYRTERLVHQRRTVTCWTHVPSARTC